MALLFLTVLSGSQPMDDRIDGCRCHRPRSAPGPRSFCTFCRSRQNVVSTAGTEILSLSAISRLEKPDRFQIAIIRSRCDRRSRTWDASTPRSIEAGLDWSDVSRESALSAESV